MPEVIRFKLATLAPKGIGWARHAEKILIPWVIKTTDNNLRLKVYWGGILGNDDDYLRKMEIGQLQGGALTGLGANLACPEFSVIGLPFLFESYEEVDHIRHTMMPLFEREFLGHGYRLIMWVDQDFDQIYSTIWKFDSLEDFAKAKIGTWYGPQEEVMLKALGAHPIPPGRSGSGAPDIRMEPSTQTFPRPSGRLEASSTP